MQYLKNIIIAITILLGLITFAQSETSWIKKKDKTETVKKVEKEKTTSWIKKKEVNENKKKPYSDEELSDKLDKLGFHIARRTVAKYRDQLGFAVARLRREL